MSNEEELRRRVDELEIRLAHQDQTVEELNEAFAAQWRSIDEMSRKIALLESRLLSLEQNADASPSSDPPPPHY